MMEETEAGAQAARLRLERVEARGPEDFDAAFAALSTMRVGGLIVLASPVFLSERRRIADLATSHRLPTMFILREFAEAGGLMSYGPSYVDLWRRTSSYVDKVLKGAKPSELPVEQPDRFELLINLRTARGLGLTIPASVLARADQVIH